MAKRSSTYDPICDTSTNGFAFTASRSQANPFETQHRTEAAQPPQQRRRRWSKWHDEPLYSAMMSAIKAVRFHGASYKQASSASGTVVPCRTLRRYVAMSRDEPDTIFYLPEQHENMQAIQPPQPPQPPQNLNHITCGQIVSRGSTRPMANNSTGVSGLDELLGSASDREMRTNNSSGVDQILGSTTDSCDQENFGFNTCSSFSQGNWSSCKSKAEPLCRGDSFGSLISEFSVVSVDDLSDDMIVDEDSNSYVGNDFNRNSLSSSNEQAPAADTSNLFLDDEMSFDLNFSDFR